MEHHYISTACLHEQHDACRLTCKFCQSKCLCDCHHVTLGGVGLKLDLILTQVKALQAQGVIEMANVKDVQDRLTTLQTDVEAETDVVTAIETLVNGQNDMLISLRQQLADAIAGNDPAALQAVVDSLDTITATNQANASKIAALAVANTPAAPDA